MRKRQPGRPRKALPGHESGHIPGTGVQQRRMSRAEKAGALANIAVAPLTPRLLDLHGAAVYLGLSEWTIRDLEAAGTVLRVRIPLANDGELRKLLFDRDDLDRLIQDWKDARP